MKNLISVLDLGRDGVEEVLAKAEEMISYAEARKVFLIEPNTSLVKPCLFELFLEKSLRTWGSFATAAEQVGFHYRPILGVEQTSIPKGESFANTLRMLEIQQRATMLVLRTTWEGAARFASEIISIPIINGGDGCNWHPSQTLQDAKTIQKKLGRLNDFTLGIVGDLSHSRVARGLLTLARFYGFRVGIISAPETRPPRLWLKKVDLVFETEDLNQLRECAVIYLLRLQKERFKDEVELQRMLGRTQFSREVLDRYCQEGVLVLHAQPIDQDRGILRLEPHIFDDPRIITHQQAWFGLPTRIAINVLAYEHRLEPTVIPQIGPIVPDIKRRVSIDAHHRELAEKRGQVFRPITSGTVVDHIPENMGDVFMRIIKRSGTKIGRPRITAEELDSKKMLNGRKDVLVFGETFLANYVMATIGLFAPSATFNIAKEGVFTKAKMPIPEMIPGILPCPNPDCICNNDPEAVTRFWTIRSAGEEVGLLCGYCERLFTKEEVLRKIRA